MGVVDILAIRTPCEGAVETTLISTMRFRGHDRGTPAIVLLPFPFEHRAQRDCISCRYSKRWLLCHQGGVASLWRSVLSLVSCSRILSLQQVGVSLLLSALPLLLGSTVHGERGGVASLGAIVAPHATFLVGCVEVSSPLATSSLLSRGHDRGTPAIVLRLCDMSCRSSPRGFSPGTTPLSTYGVVLQLEVAAPDNT